MIYAIIQTITRTILSQLYINLHCDLLEIFDLHRLSNNYYLFVYTHIYIYTFYFQIPIIKYDI